MKHNVSLSIKVIYDIILKQVCTKFKSNQNLKKAVYSN